MFEILDSHSSGTRTFTFTGKVVSESFIDAFNFDISICKVVASNEPLINIVAGGRLYYDRDHDDPKYVIDANTLLSDTDNR